MKVAFISHSAKLEGAERSLLDLVVGIKNYGVQATVVLPRYGPLVEELKNNNISVIIHPYHNWLGRNYKLIKGLTRFIINRVSVPGLIRKLKEKKFDLIYTNTLATPVGAMVASKNKIKHIWHARELVEGMDLDFDYGTRRATRYIAMNSSYIIYNSYAVEKKFKPLFENIPGEVIYNGMLDGEPKKRERKVLTPDGTIKLCIVGRMHRGKGQHHAINALSILKSHFPKIELDIVGSGNRSYVRKLKKLCTTNGLSECVTWSGFTNDVAAVYKRSDIALVCSKNEGFGRVVVEAMAEGCPVVGSDSGGIPEIIEHGVSGLLYKSGRVEDLAKQVSHLINNSELYSQISRKGMVDVYKRFSRQRYVEQIYQVLNTLQK